MTYGLINLGLNVNIKVDFAIDPEHLEENIYKINILYQLLKQCLKILINFLYLITYYS